MKLNDNAVIAVLMICGMVGLIFTAKYESERPTSIASSFTHYSDSTWQVNDTLFIRHGADTIKFDVTKLK